ncbi:MAG: hypothetical protein ABII27_04275 [bacterium]
MLKKYYLFFILIIYSCQYSFCLAPQGLNALLEIKNIVLFIDYDNSLEEADKELSGENLDNFVANLSLETIMVVHTGRDRSRIWKNLVDPVMAKLAERKDIGKLRYLKVVHDLGSGAFGFDEIGQVITYKTPKHLKQNDMNIIAQSLIDELFVEFEGMDLRDKLKSYLKDCKRHATAELDKVKLSKSWSNSNQGKIPVQKLHLIPEEFRSDDLFGDIFIWNRGNMLTLEFDYVNKEIGIGNRTMNIRERARTTIGSKSSTGDPLYYNSHSNAVDVSLAEKGPTVSEIFYKYIEPNLDKNHVILISAGDSTGDLSVFKIDFGDYIHLKMFLGNKPEEIEKALEIPDTFLSSRKFSIGGLVLLRTINKLIGNNSLTAIELLKNISSKSNLTEMSQ